MKLKGLSKKAPALAQGTLEADSAAELTELQKAFKDRAKEEARRLSLATDSEYWACLCFQSREQLEAFMKVTKWDNNGQDKYIDGRKVARLMGIELPVVEFPGTRPVNKRLASLAQTD